MTNETDVVEPLPISVVGSRAETISHTAQLPVAVFLPNWSRSVRVSTVWQTDVVESKTAAEERRGLNGRPYRTLEVDIMTRKSPQVNAMRQLLKQASRAATVWPLTCDVTRVTGPVTGRTIPCETSYRRLFVGQYVLIMRYSRDFQVTQYQWTTVTSITPSSITISEDPTYAWDSNDRVYPAINVRVVPSMSVDVLTDRHYRAKVTLIEVRGKSALPPVETANTTINGFSEWRGIPVLHLKPAWGNPTRTGYKASGGFAEASRDVVYEPRADFPKRLFEVKYVFNRRERFWDLLRLFENCAGRTFPFVFAAHGSEYEVISYVPAVLSVVATGYEAEWDSDKLVAIWLRSGYVHVSAVVSVNRTGGGYVDELTLAEPMPDFPADQILRASQAIVARWDTDELREEWISGNVVQCTMKAVELQRERTYAAIQG